MLTRRRPRGDDGAMAVMVALLAFVLFGLAALAMDLGNAFSRKRDVQFQADFAALAGGSGLPGASLTPSATDDAIKKAAEYLFRNTPQDDDATDFPDAAAVAAALVDGDPLNGEAYYGHLDPVSGALIPDRYELTVRTPPALVKYGFAQVFQGDDEGEVNAYATVGVRSPGTGTMPFFAVQGCDYGPQTLSDPANGQVQPVVPNMQYPTDTNRSNLDSLAPPARVNLNSDPAVQQTITINGTFLSGVTKVGFFRDISLTPNFFETTLPTANSTGNTVANVVVPIGVTSVEDVWWVRVFGPQSGNNPPAWSDPLEALPMRVGDSLLECGGASNDGNFGSLRLPRSTGTTAEWLPQNIALGLEAPLSLAVYPGNPPPAFCTPGVPPAVYSTTTGGSSTLRPGTNCLDTDTGLPANDLTQGLVTGGTGRLLKPTASDCSPERDDDERTIAVGGGGGTAINDDTLSCFLTTNTNIDTISRPAYSGPPALSADIYSSPRFFWIPVLGVEPLYGGSQRYSIVDFRPAFITSDALSSTKAVPVFNDGSGVVSASATNNGLFVANNGITRMRVVFFNSKALPADAGGAATVAYMGVGPKILAMTN